MIQANAVLDSGHQWHDFMNYDSVGGVSRPSHVIFLFAYHTIRGAMELMDAVLLQPPAALRYIPCIAHYLLSLSSATKMMLTMMTSVAKHQALIHAETVSLAKHHQSIPHNLPCPPHRLYSCYCFPSSSFHHHDLAQRYSSQHPAHPPELRHGCPHTKWQ
mmetsp:Transcript_9380/g.21155  ORF Transcript_9380/g.21155 Transcript_9380/m.21155 type:complete len:160 (-) Transcript_9380:47-526(-)